MAERVQKILAQAGVCSRAKAEDLIKQGRVSVNGKVITIGTSAEATDKILVDDKPIKIERLRYVLFNKPKGVVTSLSDPHNKTIQDFIPIRERVFPVGRLDKDAEGLLFLTNDGDLANKIMHPRYETTKTYEVLLSRPFTDNNKLKRIKIEGRPVDIRDVKQAGNKVTITIHEGRKHIVKKIFHAIGYTITKLKRTKISKLSLGTLDVGEWRDLTEKELKKLKQSVQTT